MNKPSVEVLHDLLKYDKDTGKLFWKERPRKYFQDDGSWKKFNTRYAGLETFHFDNCRGYFKGQIFKVTYVAHRVIWCMHYGDWPSDTIDHINHNRKDNRIENLRDVSMRENNMNFPLPCNNTSGFVGVVYDKKRSLWMARVKIHKKNKFLGYFKEKENAIEARKKANLQYGFHSNHGLLVSD